MAQESGFSEFESNYDKVNRIDTDTFAFKKTYDETPYLVLPNFKFGIKLGDNKPNLKCFVRKRGEQFGDPIVLPGLDGYSIRIKIYNYSNQLVCSGIMEVTDLDAGQIEYVFSSLDFNASGVYYFEVEFNGEGESFTLPESNIKQEIIVRN